MPRIPMLPLPSSSSSSSSSIYLQLVVPPTGEIALIPWVSPFICLLGCSVLLPAGQGCEAWKGCVISESCVQGPMFF